MKLAEYKFTLYCSDKWSERQIEEALSKLEIVEERMSQYLRDNVYTISKDIRVEG